MSNKGLGSLGLISQYSDSDEEDSSGENQDQDQGETDLKSKVNPSPSSKSNSNETPTTITMDTSTSSAETVNTSTVTFGSAMPTDTPIPTFSSFAEQADTAIEDEDDDVVPVGAVVRARAGQSYTEIRIKEEPLSEVETEDSQTDSSSSSGEEGEDKEKGAKDTDKSKSKKKKKGETIADDSDDSEWEDEDGKAKKTGPPKAKGELGFEDLPPIEDLHISVPHDEVQPIGVIKSVVDPLVVVEALPNTPALDIDSILFLDEGDRALGSIFDVIGQVKRPFYCVRFNSLEHIESKGVEKGMSVYCAPSTPHTSYVLLAQLQKMKGTDASWRDDIEPPPDVQEFSDDEAERMVKKQGRRKKKTANPNPNDPNFEAGQDMSPQAQSQSQNGSQSPKAPLHRPRYSRGIQRFPPPNNRDGSGNGHSYRNSYGNQFSGGPQPSAGDGSWHTHPALTLTHPYQNFPQVFSNNDTQNYNRGGGPSQYQSGPVAYSNITARNCWPHPHGPFIGPPRWNPGQNWTNPNTNNPNWANAPIPPLPQYRRNSPAGSGPSDPPPPPGC